MPSLPILERLLLETLAKFLRSCKSFPIGFPIIFNWATRQAAYLLLLDNIIIVLLEWPHCPVCIKILIDFFFDLVNVYPCIFFIVVLCLSMMIIVRLCRYHHFRWVLNLLSILNSIQVYNARIVTLRKRVLRPFSSYLLCIVLLILI